MKLEKKEKALEDLRVVVEGDFKGVEEILSSQGEVAKSTGVVSDVSYTEFDLDKRFVRINAKYLINLLVNEFELFKVRDDREEDGSITYTFIFERTSKKLVVELMIVWKK